MGIIPGKNTRRISIDNTLVITPALIQKPIEDAEDLAIVSFKKTAPPELNFTDNTSKYMDLRDEDHDYWTQRIESLKNDHHEINQLVEKEYAKTIKNNNELYQSSKISQEKIQKITPCFDWRTKILQCYEENPRQPLVCASIVQAFSNCVSSYQLED